ncbi:hypothetical protein S2M10_07200 [Sphingomonas sp. S2M10]|uniref:DUF4402 domain-containing protein n=1 Tax=Sphingomonas sp. S2M10 TaxID=2705010 RepID=UPI0014566BE0|nr:DUF4402 domain-containing protein [Sphingomonas sp. S2M10]NLS25749.1 hypothetical protein [Sphingomonas sp. S2M10]
MLLRRLCPALALLLPHAALAQVAETATGSLTIVQPLTITKDADLRFGSIVKPWTTGSVAISTTGARSVTDGVQALSAGDTPQAARFTVAGAGGRALSIQIPPVITLSSGTHALLVTTTSNLTGALAAQVLSGSPKTAGSLEVRVGGSVALASTTQPGNYTGVLTVSAAYN